MSSDKLPKEYFIHGRECESSEMEAYLRATQSCDVFLTIFYAHKPASVSVWHCSRFTENSNLIGNLHSRNAIRGWESKQITRVKLEIK